MKGVRNMAIVLSLLAVLCTLFAVLAYQGIRSDVPREGIIFAQAEIPVSCLIYHGPMLDHFFTEPFEKGVFVFKNFRAVIFTNQIAEGIFYPEIFKVFKNLNLRIEDCILHVHNHLVPSTFSEADKKFASYLRANGFKGDIALFIAPNIPLQYLK